MTHSSASTGANAPAFSTALAGRLYDGFWAVAGAVCAPLAALSRDPAGRLRGKLGRYPRAGHRRECWIHACSVGEVGVALRCMAALREVRPGLAFTLTTVTPEGHALATARIAAPDSVAWFAFDGRTPVRRAFDAFRPDFIILSEVELWPNHLAEAAARGIPVFVINARLTACEERRYRTAGAFMRRAFAVPRIVLAQTAADATRFSALGATRVEVTGSMKFDPDPGRGAPRPAAWMPSPGRTGPILLGASTHKGEEEILLRCARASRSRSAVLLVLVPRHPQRAKAVAALARRAGFDVALASASRDSPPAGCLVVDTVGDLAALYERATLAFVGKSLTARGGQNFLEAVGAGCPVVVGPHVGNFAEVAAEFIAGEAIVQVPDEDTLTREIIRLLADAPARAAQAARAGRILERRRGATARNVRLILSALEDDPVGTFTAGRGPDKQAAA